MFSLRDRRKKKQLFDFKFAKAVIGFEYHLHYNYRGFFLNHFVIRDNRRQGRILP